MKVVKKVNLKDKAQEQDLPAGSPVPKANAKAKGKAKAKAVPKAQAKTKAKAKVSPLSAKSLAALKDLGGTEQMSLDEKIAALRASVEANGAANAAPAAAVLTKLDRSKIWQKAQVEMKTNLALKADYDAASDQGKVAQSKVLLAYTLDPSCGHLYSDMTQTISNIRSVEKTIKWISQKQADDKWTPEEQEAHLNSGKLAARECPQTPGVWEYRDNFDVASKQKIEKIMSNQAHTSNVHHESDAHDEWNELFAGVDMSAGESLIRQVDSMEVKLGKGKGKASQLAIIDIAGKGKGKVKKLPAPPAPGNEKDPADVAIAKCKQAISLVDKTDLSLNEDMHAMAKSPYMTAKIKTTFLTYMDKLAAAKKRLRTDLLKAKDLSIDQLKETIGNQIGVVKEVQGFMRQHKGISSAQSQMGKDDWYGLQMSELLCYVIYWSFLFLFLIAAQVIWLFWLLIILMFFVFELLLIVGSFIFCWYLALQTVA